uniref:Uncharacterized protein n=1 Tax=Anguilla anguilla TaxID=7936 RepID=A0A0E9XI35_ANGAN
MKRIVSAKQTRCQDLSTSDLQLHLMLASQRCLTLLI